ncbi:MAG: DUF1653 domain-containing protein [Clostridia bacterium]|nr:DUF1653 domain-containing protein [Clostridia bacterium]
MIPANGARVFILHNGEFNYQDFLSDVANEVPIPIVSDIDAVIAAANDQENSTSVEEKKEERIVKHGKYRSYKGNEFAVLALGTDYETKEKTVILKELYGDSTIWICTLKHFLEDVEVDGRKVHRFERIDND